MLTILCYDVFVSKVIIVSKRTYFPVFVSVFLRKIEATVRETSFVSFFLTDSGGIEVGFAWALLPTIGFRFKILCVGLLGAHPLCGPLQYISKLFRIYILSLGHLADVILAHGN